MDMNWCLINFYLLSVRGSPRDLRVFDETISTMKLAWQAAPGNVLQYLIVFKPAEGGERREISVKGDTTQAVLKNLQAATEYELFVSARYTTGVGDPLLGTGTTLEGKGECCIAKNLTRNSESMVGLLLQPMSDRNVKHTLWLCGFRR